MKKNIRMGIATLGIMLGVYVLFQFYPSHLGGIVGSVLCGLGIGFLFGKEKE